MAKLITPFIAQEHEPSQPDGTWQHVENRYVYNMEDPEDFPGFPELPIGLVGEIASFIEAKAPRPMRSAALIGALGFVAGIVGRAWNVEGSGLNEYFVLLAPSSSGKEAATKGPEILLNAVVQKVPDASTFIGPGDVSSKAALARYTSKATPPCFAMFIPEFGEWIEPIVSPKASEARQSLRKMLLDLSEKGGKGSVLRKSAYADSANNIDDVYSPAVTIVGDSNPTTFFEAVSERNTGNGFFARFIILQSEDRVAPYNKAHASVQPSARLLEDLGSLCCQSLNLNHAKMVLDVVISESAQDELNDFRNTCDEGRDLAEDEYKRAVWGRGYVHSLRVAAILAVGRNLYFPTIEICDARWAISLITCSIEKLLNKFEDGEVGNVSQSEVARLNEVKRAITRYITAQWPEIASYAGERNSNLHTVKIVPYGYIQRSVYKLKPFKDAAFGKSSDAIKQTIRIMVERGELSEISRAVLAKNHSFSGVAYAVERPEVFME
ncbi:hypothetical protein GGR95_001399 [Sulfitobacter undariae]|uniref:DUF3987 domain-containing protein n=1 Tax=Sulfitobacter undariae TaxID=1563671 RepID=A0A7W6H0M5_9RHOB|nr:hypothetical protein [Sulfitobacter undariae]MBB3993768.1 hypothetical protein [Sulfitobacter undariae]